jgi:hypothetical protein
MGGRSVAGEAHAQGCTEKKVVKPAQQRLMVQYLRSTYGLGIRRACRTLPIARSTYKYRSRAPQWSLPLTWPNYRRSRQCQLVD